ncbi:PAS domain S-box protein [Flavisolibacter nicotianae]|uniref:PAS domain S-box protein n=1 Tax=Flavisolibacter nicotianae TaxID=2364882 RepID=UPI0013C52E74|nr:PAS domain S-box protein [Flavisolibacter nicotianae]
MQEADDFGAIVFILDSSLLKFIACNDTAIETLGYSRDELLQIGMQDIDAIFTREMIAAAYESVRNSEEKQATVPSRFRKKDGATFGVEVYFKAFEEGGKPYILASATRASVIEKAKEELQFHSVLFSHITDAVVSLDNDLCITSWNKYAVAIFGWTEHEVLGVSYRNLMQPFYPGISEETERRLYHQEGEWRGNVIFSRKNGERFLSNVSYGLLKDGDGNVNGSVAVIRDRTEEEKKEKQLLYLAELVNKTSDAIISIDTAFQIISWNKGAEIIYGYTAGEAIGKDITVLLGWENAGIRLTESKHRPGKEAYWQGEEKHAHKTGTEVYALVSVSLIQDENATVTGYVIVGKDISQRKQLENKLQHLNQELEQRVQRKAQELTHVFERVTDAFIALDKAWNYTYLNKKAGEVLGRSPEQLIGKNIWTEFPEKLQEPFYRLFFDVMEVQEPRRVEAWNQFYNAWFEVLLYPSPDGLSVYLQNITDKKRTEQSLEEGRKRYERIMETVQEGIWHIDENTLTTYVNPYLASLLGYTPEEMVGKSALDFISPEYRNKALQNIEERKKGVSGQHELSFYNRQGQVIHTLIQSTPIYEDHQYAGSVSTLLDITQKKKAEEELRLSEQKYRIIFEKNPLPMFMLEYPKRNFVAVNNAFIEKFGYSKAELKKMNMRQLRRPGEVYKSDEIARILAENKQFRERMYLRKKDGTDLLFDVQAAEVVFEGKTVYLTSTHDITELAKAEEALLQTNKQLRELTIHLQDIREKERKHIAREIHDELGQQLTALKLELSWIAKKMTTQQEAIVTKIKSSLDVINGTIHTVRRLATELRPAMLDELGLAEAIRWQINEFSKRTAIEVDFDTNVDETVFPPDISISFFRILQESLTNIARHAEAGHVECKLHLADRFLLLQICDDGKGFHPGNTGDKKSLGLLGIKERVQMLNGEYQLSSEPMKGTKLTVNIPLNS